MLLLFFSCNRIEDTASTARLEKQLNYIDSIFISGQREAAIREMDALTPQINKQSPAIVNYYVLRAHGISHNHPKHMEAYADSALNYFNSAARKQQYQTLYLRTLLLKGDVCFTQKRYNQALYYYYEGKELLDNANLNCQFTEFAGKIAALYFEQKRYIQAAYFWKENYAWLERCTDGSTPQKYFHFKQGAFNNIGVSYAKANMPDSAIVYYKRDIDFIEATEQKKIFSATFITPAKIVVYDNLGGLCLLKNDLAAAKDYLEKCVALKDEGIDGIKIPPYIKLADTYMRSGDYIKAESAFLKSRVLLDQYRNPNIESEIKWQQLRSAYYFHLQQLPQAYDCLNNYIHVKDSVEKSLNEIYTLDIEKEFQSLKQEHALTSLEKKDQLKKTYLMVSGVFLAMLICIVLLISKHLSTIKKNNEITEQHNMSLQHTLLKLEQANKDYIRIMRIMAHDLKNPLAGMTGLSTVLLSEGNYSEEHKQMLQLIESTGMHSIGMINELLESGLANEKEVMQKEPVDLQALLQQSVELMQFKASEKHQQIILGSHEAVIANVNQEKIWRVFNNLIINAIKFSPEGSYIHVSVERIHKWVRVRIADQGIGIAEQDRDKVFDMFTSAKKQGTKGEQPFGLGLSISKKIIDMHNGNIWFKDNPSGGTIFFIELPL